MGMRAFILSGYPHREECELLARYLLPRLKTCKQAEAQGRVISDPVTPLTTATRKQSALVVTRFIGSDRQPHQRL